jgi:multiple sugar transport system ATP-binding protein
MTLGSRVAVIEEGVIQQYDRPQRIYDHPANRFVGGFIGSPSMNFLDARVVKENGNYYVDGGSFKLILPEKFSSDIGSYVDNQVTFGIRPENLKSEDVTADPDPEKSMKVHVRVTEPLGDEIVVYADSGDQEIVAQLDPRTDIAPNQETTYYAEMEYTHIFDKDTGEAII